MDKDSKLIFESYQNSQLLNESFWRRLFKPNKIIFPKGTGAQVDNILSIAAGNITRVSIRNPNFFTEVNRQLSEDVIGIVQTLVAPARRANDEETLGYLRTIAVRFNEAITKFDELGKELTKIKRENLESLIKITDDNLDDTKQLFEGYANSKTINPTFSEQSKQAINYINELQNTLKQSSRALSDKGTMGKAWDVIKTHWIISTLAGLAGIGTIGAGEAAGYGIISLLKFIVEAITSALADMTKGGVEAMKSGEEPATRSATLAPTTTPETTPALRNASEVSFDQYFQPSPTRR